MIPKNTDIWGIESLKRGKWKNCSLAVANKSGYDYYNKSFHSAFYFNLSAPINKYFDFNSVFTFVTGKNVLKNDLVFANLAPWKNQAYEFLWCN